MLHASPSRNVPSALGRVKKECSEVDGAHGHAVILSEAKNLAC